MSLYARIAALVIVVLAIAGAWWKFDRMLAKADEQGYTRRAQEDAAVSEQQAERNRELQRAAEKRYTVVVQKQTAFFSKTAKEVHDAAAPLASCPVPDDLRLRINAAAACARQDPAAACGADAAVPVTR